VPRLPLPPLVPGRQPPGLASGAYALGVRVAPLRVVPLREEQDVVAHRGEPAATERAAIRGGLEVLRAPELPPARRFGHFFLTAGSGHFTLELDFSTRQLRATTAFADRARATLITSLETCAR
jgi:hypothetical protein